MGHEDLICNRNKIQQKLSITILHKKTKTNASYSFITNVINTIIIKMLICHSFTHTQRRKYVR